jgi:sn-glycerol 3-phosphate transport system permease protein
MMRLRDSLFGWALIAPTLLILGIFVIYPALSSFYLSLHDFDAFMTTKTFVGLDNYRLLFISPQYWQSIWVSIGFTLLTVVPSAVLSLFFAVALDNNPYFRGVLRTVFLMPVAVSSAMAAMLWVFIYNPSSGYLNFILERLGVSGPNWLGDPSWALIAVSIATIWKEIGFNIIFFLAGLASIPADLREAALIDGAKPIQTFFYVTLPMLSPTIFFVSVVSVINAFQSFGQIYILTDGGPAGATNTLVYNLYRDAFRNFQTGSASAQAIVLFFIMLIITMIQFRFAKNRVHYS